MKPTLSAIAQPHSLADLNRSGQPQAPPTAEAAKQFEEIFLRKMLSEVMKSAKMGGGSSVAGAEMYDSMVVDALSTAIADAGGLGLGDAVRERIEAQHGLTGGGEPVRVGSGQNPFQIAGHPGVGPMDGLGKPSSKVESNRLSKLEVAPSDLSTRRIR